MPRLGLGKPDKCKVASARKFGDALATLAKESKAKVRSLTSSHASHASPPCLTGPLLTSGCARVAAIVPGDGCRVSGGAYHGPGASGKPPRTADQPPTPAELSLSCPALLVLQATPHC